MKNIILCGVAKSGKTYIAKKINKNGKYNHIPIDYFTSSFKHIFPEIGISSNVVITRESSKKLALFLSKVIEIIDNVDNKELYILDSAHLYPSDIIKYIDTNKWDVYFLGYPKITIEDKFLQMRKYVHDGWPNKKKDDELKETIKELIQISKVIETECKKYNIKFVDASEFETLNKLHFESEKV